MFWDFEDSYRIFKACMIISFLIRGKLAARRTLLYFQFGANCYPTSSVVSYQPSTSFWSNQQPFLLITSVEKRSLNSFLGMSLSLLPNCCPVTLSPKSRYCPFYNLSQSVSSLLCFMDTLYPARWLLPICAETLSNKALITHWRYMSKSTLANQSQA